MEAMEHIGLIRWIRKHISAEGRTQQRLKRLSERFRHVYDDGCWNTDCAYDTYFLAKGYRIVGRVRTELRERGKYEAVVGEKIR